jgi:hypothetical protein
VDRIDAMKVFVSATRAVSRALAPRRWRRSRHPRPAQLQARHQERYRGRHLVESAFCRLKDFRRVHALRANFLSGAALATAMAFWRHTSLGP